MSASPPFGRSHSSSPQPLWPQVCSATPVRAVPSSESNLGFYRFPDIHGDVIVFAAEAICGGSP